MFNFQYNNALLIQCGHTNPLFIDMLRLTQQRHTAYCLGKNIDYWCMYGMPIYAARAAWDKVYFIRQAMQLHYEHIIWLDTDTAIIDLSADIRDALTKGDIGACEHYAPWFDKSNIPRHYNVGALYFHNTPIAKEFVEEWWKWHEQPKLGRWMEQGVFNDIVRTDKYKDAFEKLDDKWNATVTVNEVNQPVVKGYHGVGPNMRRLDLMRLDLPDDWLTYRGF